MTYTPWGYILLAYMNQNKNVNSSILQQVQDCTEHSRSDGERSRTIKEKTRKRINIIKGQLDGLLKMIGEDKYCIDLLNQSLAIQNSIKSLDALLFERHLKTHVVDQFQNETHKAIEELRRLFKRIHQ